MNGATGTLWHYLGAFMLYTLLAIGFIYAAFWYLKKNGTAWLPLGQKSIQSQDRPSLEIESMLPLEARKNLYVVKSGQERFLVATSLEGTQFLSRLEPEHAAQSIQAEPPTKKEPC